MASSKTAANTAPVEAPAVVATETVPVAASTAVGGVIAVDSKAAASGERTYLGPSDAVLTSEDAKPFKPGDKVTLNADVLARLTDAGHSFDPPLREASRTRTPEQANSGIEV